MSKIKFDALSLYCRNLYNYEILDRLDEYKNALFKDNIDDFLVDTPDGRTSITKVDTQNLFFLGDGIIGSYTANMHCREALTRRVIVGNNKDNPLVYNAQCVTFVYVRLPKNRVHFNREYSRLDNDAVEIDPNSLRYYVQEFIDKTLYRDEEGDLGPLEDMDRWINIREYNYETAFRNSIGEVETKYEPHYEIVFPVFYDYLKQGTFYKMFPSMLIYWLRYGRHVFTDGGKRYKWDNMMKNIRATTPEYFWMAILSSDTLNTFSLERGSNFRVNGPQSYFAHTIDFMRDTTYLARLFNARNLTKYMDASEVTILGNKTNSYVIRDNLTGERYKALFAEIAQNMRSYNE